MSLVELSPTLVSRLGALESHVLDPSVQELLIAGPNHVWITKDGRTERLDLRIDEGTIRSLASRLVRTLAWKSARAARTGLIAPELHVSVVGTPRGERCPVVRFVRRSLPKRTLSQLAQEGMLDRDAELRLLQACRNRRSIVISGHPGSGRTDLLAALARVWKEERRVAVFDVPEGRLTNAEVGHVILEPTVGAEGAAMLGADVIVADDPQSALWSQLLNLGRPFLATVEAADAQGALDRIVALCLAERADASQIAGMALVESAVGLVVEMERAHGRPALRAIAEPQRLNGHLSARPLLRPHAENEGPPMSRAPEMPSRPGNTASGLRSMASIPNQPTPSHGIDIFAFEGSEVSEIRPESLMSASFVGRIPGSAPPAVEITNELRPPEEVKSAARSVSERVPTLIGRQDSGELPTSAKSLNLGSMIPDLGEDDTHPPPDEMTMHAEASEMTLEPSYRSSEQRLPSSSLDEPDIEHEAFDDSSYTAPSSPNGIDDDPDETQGDKEFGNERTPYSPFADNKKKKDSLTDEEIEGMLSDLEDVVHLGDDDGPKAKRRPRKAR